MLTSTHAVDRLGVLSRYYRGTPRLVYMVAKMVLVSYVTTFLCCIILCIILCCRLNVRMLILFFTDFQNP